VAEAIKKTEWGERGMKLVFVTGMSGAGKSSVLRMLEDAGYFCVDNLPISLIITFATLTSQACADYDKVVLSVDIRSGKALGEMEKVLNELKEMGYDYEILFLDADTSTLVKRFKETRRIHPYANTCRIDAGIEKEREQLTYLRNNADYILDTSRMLIRELKADIDSIFVAGEKKINFVITILSFGYKYGIPSDCDIVFDVRFLPNPYYVPELKEKTGNDKEVYDYVMNGSYAAEFLEKLREMILFLIPRYIEEGKNHLVIGIGCTGGRHRSVTIARSLHDGMESVDCALRLEHRDIKKYIGE